MSMVATMIYLEPDQKAALQRAAKAKGSSLAAEIREAIAKHLAGSISEEELNALDLLTQEAQIKISDMAGQLREANALLKQALQDIERIRGRQHLAGDEEVEAMLALLNEARI